MEEVSSQTAVSKCDATPRVCDECGAAGLIASTQTRERDPAVVRFRVYAREKRLEKRMGALTVDDSHVSVS